MEKQPLLNTYVNNVDMDETLSSIDKMILSGEKSYVVCRCRHENRSRSVFKKNN